MYRRAVEWLEDAGKDALAGDVFRCAALCNEMVSPCCYSPCCWSIRVQADGTVAAAVVAAAWWRCS